LVLLPCYLAAAVHQHAVMQAAAMTCQQVKAAACKQGPMWANIAASAIGYVPPTSGAHAVYVLAYRRSHLKSSGPS